MKRTILLLVALLSPDLPAVTEVGGILRHDTRWVIEEGPYIVTSDIVVPPGIRLSISPGVKIIIHSPDRPDTSISQIDKVDSSLVSIKVFGILTCAGKFEQRIRFTGDPEARIHPRWYGIVMSKADDRFSEIAFTDIEDAYSGITIMSCKPTIRNSLLERNHIGVTSSDESAPKIYNCLITHNTAYGIRISNSNPVITNNIIYNNANNGIWCDGVSHVKFSYNCIFGNSDGDFLDCDPEAGIPGKKHSREVPVDAFHNILADPVFTSSAAELDAREKDLSVPTRSNLIKNKLIAAVLYPPKEPLRARVDNTPTKRFTLSPYSPCSNAGDPAKNFLDRDGSRNDIGLNGGPEFIEEKAVSTSYPGSSGAKPKHKAKSEKKKKGH